MGGEGQDTQRLSAVRHAKARFFWWVLIILICYSGLVWCLKVYPNLLKQAHQASQYHRHMSWERQWYCQPQDCTGVHSIKFSFRSLKNHSPSLCNTLLHTERLLWEALKTVGVQGLPTRFLISSHKLIMNHDCFSPHLPIPVRATLSSSFVLF